MKPEGRKVMNHETKMSQINSRTKCQSSHIFFLFSAKSEGGQPRAEKNFYQRFFSFFGLRGLGM
jgi:hypothetical protein